MFNLAKFFQSTSSALLSSSNTPTRKFNELKGQAIVEQTIQPGINGRVHFRNSWWPAQCQQNMTLVPGEIVDVIGHDNITLLVEPASRSERHHLTAA